MAKNHEKEGGGTLSWTRTGRQSKTDTGMAEALTSNKDAMIEERNFAT